MLRMRSLSIAALLAATMVSGAGEALADGYVLKVLAVPGAADTFSVGISSAGVIAGTSFASGTTSSFTYDTRLQTPTYVPFTVTPFHGGTVTDTVIAAMSLKGAIVGNYTERVGSTSTTYGFVYSGGSFTSLEYPGSVQTSATAVASLGEYVAGVYFTPGRPHPFVYHAGTYREISGAAMGDYDSLQPQTISNSGFVTGSYFSIDRNQNRSFTTTGTAAVDFHPTISGIAACGINGANPPANKLVGFCYSPVQGLLMDGGSAKLTTAPGASLTTFGAISVSGAIAGYAVVGSNNEIFQLANGVYRTQVLPKKWTGISVVGINSAGKIVGRFSDANNVIKVFMAR